ncbi:MAG: HAD family hydrolase [Saprospirales bacterium]|nr:HAD family hydrolase [Saprospirales bacterium]
MARKRKIDARPYREVPFARTTVERLLADPSFEVAIATGGWREPALFKLRHLLFPVEAIPLVGADHKHTREAILQEAVELVRKTEPQITRTVYIGDALWDVRTTRQLEMSFVGIRVRGDVELLQCEGVRHVFTDFSDYDRFLEAVHRAGPPGLPGGEIPGYKVF